MSPIQASSESCQVYFQKLSRIQLFLSTFTQATPSPPCWPFHFRPMSLTSHNSRGIQLNVRRADPVTLLLKPPSGFAAQSEIQIKWPVIVPRLSLLNTFSGNAPFQSLCSNLTGLLDARNSISCLRALACTAFLLFPSCPQGKLPCLL